MDTLYAYLFAFFIALLCINYDKKIYEILIEIILILVKIISISIDNKYFAI